MLITIAAVVAALLHLLFFVFESVLWTRPAASRLFGPKHDTNATAALFALNQGFYNLFLALFTLAALYLRSTPHAVLGTGMLVTTCGTMVGAGVVLFVSAPPLRVGALLQALPPLAVLLSLWRGW